MKKKILIVLLLAIFTAGICNALLLVFYTRHELEIEIREKQHHLLLQMQSSLGCFQLLMKNIEREMIRLALPTCTKIARQQPDYHAWTTLSPQDLKSIADQNKVDEVYIINRQGVIVQSSLTTDIGMNLNNFPYMTPFLESVYGKGQPLYHGLSPSSREGKFNFYVYFSPEKSDYIVEISIDCRKFITENYGTDYYENAFNACFGELMKNSPTQHAVDLCIIDPSIDWSWSYLWPDQKVYYRPSLAKLIMKEKNLTITTGNQVKTYCLIEPLKQKGDQATFPFTMMGIITYDLSRITQVTRDMTIAALIATIVVAGMVFFLTSRWFGKIYINRMLKVHEDVMTIEQGNKPSFPSIEGTDEIADIGTAINHLASTIEERTRALVNAERNFQQAQKMECVGTLVSGLAHDFNNMLTGIIGAAELIRYHLEENPEGKKYLAMLVDTAEKATHLIAGLMAFSRQQASVSQLFDLHETIQRTVDLLKSTIDRRIEIILDLKAVNSRIQGDPSQMQSLILNLAINSSHAMPDGGRIEITTTDLEVDANYCDNSPYDITPGKYLAIDVSDTGHGIRPENLSRIFEPFFTTKEPGKGTGLGLAAVHGTIVQHQGEVSVQSEVGSGTRFRILLPISLDSSEKQAEDPKMDMHGNGKILLVDDDRIVLITTERMLVQLGYGVEQAENGEDALSRFRQNPHEFNLILLDSVMPGMNGIDCLREIRKIRPDIHIILMSGNMKDETIRILQDYQCDFLQKPFRLNQLSHLIASFLATGPRRMAQSGQ